MAKWAEVKQEDDDDEEETEAITEEECLFDQRISVRVCFYWFLMTTQQRTAEIFYC